MEQYGFGIIVVSIMKKKPFVIKLEQYYCKRKEKKVVKIKTLYGNQTKQKLK